MWRLPNLQVLSITTVIFQCRQLRLVPREILQQAESEGEKKIDLIWELPVVQHLFDVSLLLLV